MKFFIVIFSLFTANLSEAQKVKSFRNGNIELFYEIEGRGKPLYILTGGPGHPPAIPGHGLMDSLKQNYTVVLLHQRGTGKSRGILCNEENINVKAFISDIAMLMKARGDHKITLLGISWGGFLAQAFAAFHPQKVSDLVLVCAAPPSYKLWPVLEGNQFARYSQTEKDSMRLLQNIFNTKSPADLEALKLTHPSSKELLAFYQFIPILHRSHFYDRSRIESNFDQILNDFNFQLIPIIDKEIMEKKWDITAQLKMLSIPALILYGRQDDQGESTFFLQKECLKNSKMIVIEQCGHMIWEDQPTEFYKAMKAYLIK